MQREFETSRGLKHALVQALFPDAKRVMDITLDLGDDMRLPLVTLTVAVDGAQAEQLAHVVSRYCLVPAGLAFSWQRLQPSGLCTHHDLARRYGPDAPSPAPPLEGCPECAPALAAGTALLGRGPEPDLSGARAAAPEASGPQAAGGRG